MHNFSTFKLGVASTSPVLTMLLLIVGN